MNSCIDLPSGDLMQLDAEHILHDQNREASLFDSRVDVLENSDTSTDTKQVVDYENTDTFDSTVPEDLYITDSSDVLPAQDRRIEPDPDTVPLDSQLQDIYIADQLDFALLEDLPVIDVAPITDATPLPIDIFLTDLPVIDIPALDTPEIIDAEPVRDLTPIDIAPLPDINVIDIPALVDTPEIIDAEPVRDLTPIDMVHLVDVPLIDAMLQDLPMVIDLALDSMPVDESIPDIPIFIPEDMDLDATNDVADYQKDIQDDIANDNAIDQIPLDLAVVEDMVIDAIIEPVLPISCADILQIEETSTSGIYDVYLNGDIQNSTEVYCDMTTEGGGWTSVFISEENLNTNFFEYTIPLNSEEMLVSHRNSDMEIIGIGVVLDIIDEWRIQHPLSFFAETSNTRAYIVNFEETIPEEVTVLYGHADWHEMCQIGRWANNATRGQFCVIEIEDSPVYNNFASSSTDTCTTTEGDLWVPECSGEKIFTLFVR
ncbi:MAG: hypothetical protein HOE80_02460 [Candidatus Magasanikbacteria bacterium]|nr:hypothetical protein [Candidatus Magasanikbacteria bacterium]MBT4071563.1 hypothetical protein [Candidatus Magasanikbacteria bacterium]